MGVANRFFGVGGEHFDLDIGEQYFGREFGTGSAEQRHEHDAPTDDEPDGDGAFEPSAGLVGERFDAAAALEDAVLVFDAPAQAVPAHARQGVLDIAQFAGRQQEPLDWVGIGWRRGLARMHDPQRHGEFVALACGRTKGHGVVAQFDLRDTRFDLIARFLLGPLRARALAFDG